MKARCFMNPQLSSRPFTHLTFRSRYLRSGAGLLFLLLLLATAACSSAATADQPPEIRYGEDACDHCRMIINEPRFAASYVTDSQETRRFDDIGNMMAHYAQYKENVSAFWVHDYESEEWLRAEDAHYVVSSDLYTPMGHGVVAFDDAARAQSLAGAHDGHVLDFPQLLAYYTTGRGQVSHNQSVHGHGDAHDH
jgi:copper chaperone NosL